MGDASHARERLLAPPAASQQRTLARPVRVGGVGLRGGAPATAELRPAPPDAGRVFVVGGRAIPGSIDAVVDTRLATTLGDGTVTVSMVEHLCAALTAVGVDNVEVHVDGAELPVLDGSARLWVAAIRNAGVRAQARPRAPLVVEREVRVEAGASWATLTPAPRFELDVTIDFPHPAIGVARWSGPAAEGTFTRELAWARTFGFLKDAEALRAAGIARGATLDNTVVYDDHGVMNPGGLRAPDEAVRHKALDAVGDVALLNRPLHARLTAFRAGHALHVALLRAVIEATAPRVARG